MSNTDIYDGIGIIDYNNFEIPCRQLPNEETELSIFLKGRYIPFDISKFKQLNKEDNLID